MLGRRLTFLSPLGRQRAGSPGGSGGDVVGDLPGVSQAALPDSNPLGLVGSSRAPCLCVFLRVLGRCTVGRGA